jgi:hypothetical protein
LNKSIVAIAICVLALGGAARADIIYTVDLSIDGGSVTGTIETNGIGIITPTDIVAYNLEVSDPADTPSSYDLNPSDSFLDYGGTDLVASLSQLTFDTSTETEAYFLFFSNDRNTYFCVQDQDVVCYGKTGGLGVNTARNMNNGATPTYVTTDGVTLIGTAKAIPEPSSLFLLLTTLLAVACVARKHYTRMRPFR